MTTPERPGDWPYGADQPAGGQPPTGPQPYAGQQPYVEPPIAGMPYNMPQQTAPYYPPPQYPQGPYLAPYPYPYAQAPSTNGMAIAAMVLGILWVYWIGSILALIFGYVARDQIKRTGQSGDGMAIAGIVLGWIGIGFLIIGIIGWSSWWW